jgi:hypothetical protein
MPQHAAAWRSVTVATESIIQPRAQKKSAADSDAFEERSCDLGNADDNWLRFARRRREFDVHECDFYAKFRKAQNALFKPFFPENMLS